MIIEIFIIYVLSFFSILSILGFGSLIERFKFCYLGNNLGFQGILGLSFLSFYSIITSFFFSHSLAHNLILIILGIILFFSFNLEKLKKILKYLLLVHLLLFLSLLIYKTHDDFNYYHFEYSYFLTQEKKFFGIGNFDLGFRTPSTIFYINSLFYLPKIKYFSFYIPSFLVLFFANLTLILSLNKKIQENYKNNFNLFIVLSVLFINIFFYRLSDHGTDRSAQILIFILFSEILFFNQINLKLGSQSFSRILILITLIIGFKAFFILYFILSIVLILKIYEEVKLKKTFEFIFKNFFTYLLILKIFLLAVINFFDSGCLLYPINYTCIGNFSWSIPSEDVLAVNNWYELWSKGGATPNFRISNPEIYIKKFNWVVNWIDVYFFNKVSDFLLSLIFLSIVIFFVFKENSKLYLYKVNKQNFLFIFLILVLLFEWFFQHPSLRYGGYCLIASLFFIFLSININFKNNKNLKKKITILVLVSMTIFNLRNINRIINEHHQYGYNPIVSAYYKVDESNFKNYKIFSCLIKSQSNCSNINLKIKKEFNRYAVIQDFKK